MPEQQRIHVIVKGQVQGVYFRASTQEQAEAIGITGWVRNLDNGDVEFEAQGEQERLDSLLLWARRGPTRARVEQLVCRDCTPVSGENGFGVRR